MPVIDVRSPAEFLSGHIPGAFNMPLFTNEERAEVGTIYKQSGKEMAVLRGLEFVGPKMADFVRQAKKTASDSHILVHCWRGGMRSGSMAWLLETSGLKTGVLKGGYKSFRNHVLESFTGSYNFHVVGGETGSGKTEILYELAKMGEQIIDLEELACHRGSSFGSIGQEMQPRPEQFENNLFQALQKIDPARRVWLEDESRSIGRVFIPGPIWEMKVAATCYRVRLPFEVRVQRLVKDYGNFPKEILAEATLRIQKRLGGLATSQALESLENGDLAETARITLRYYDKAYDFPQSTRKYEGVIFIDCEDGDPKKNAELILENLKIR
ncbi:MAG: tRNA 2-selenouridine(34) synthase MnmH [Bacteroidota bacterium]|nr:tRNA 2-selenouridine(34) synthase MnmH [Bacteroidota bacterium]